jgi:hypothetical protein
MAVVNVSRQTTLFNQRRFAGVVTTFLQREIGRL